MAADDTTISTRIFAAGRASFVVDCPSAEIRDAVEALFFDLPGGEGANARRIVIAADDDELTIDVEGLNFFTKQRPNAALTSLVTSVSRLALDADPNRLHLHCAGLALDGSGLLISAPSETGKTTLSAALAQAGWAYASDEAIAFERGSQTGTGFPKPLVIKPGGGHLLPDLEARRVHPDSAAATWWHVPVSALSVEISTEIRPSVIALLHRAADGSTDTSPVPMPMHPADAVVALMAQTMDPERFGADAVNVLAELAGSCRCVAMPVGPLDAAISVLEDLVAAGSIHNEVRVVDGSACVASWHVPGAVRSVIVGGRAVIHDTAGGGIAALDDAGTALWRALHSDAPEWCPPEALQAPGAISFLDQLASHGMIAKSSSDERTGAG